MNDDDKRAWQEHEESRAIYLQEHSKKIKELDARFEEIYRQYEELQRDYFQTLDEDEWALLGELERLREEMATVREAVVHRNLWQVLKLEAQYYNKDTDKNLLLVHIARLEKSSQVARLEDSTSTTLDIDRALLEFLQKTFNGKNYSNNNSKSDINFNLVMDTIQLSREKKKSQSWAAGMIAKKAGVSKKRIENLVGEYKKAERMRLERRFAQAVEDFSPLLSNKNDPQA